MLIARSRIGAKRIHLVRTRGGNRKFRALRLEAGNFSWGSEKISRKVRHTGSIGDLSNPLSITIFLCSPLTN